MPKYLVDVPPYHDLCSDVAIGNIDGKEVTPALLEAVEALYVTRRPGQVSALILKDFFDV